MRVRIVIGASYGDEGKGLMAQHYCDEAIRDGLRCLNVLSNGGAQRGHTAAYRGRRHVFHHLGSGSFAGADSLLPEPFIVNPLLFWQELDALDFGGGVWMHARCPWSTPFDMILNQVAEEHRGDARHGSCGLGIWETLVRRRTLPGEPLPAYAGRRDALLGFLRQVREEYLPARLRELEIDALPEAWRDVVRNDGLIQRFADDALRMLSRVRLTDAPLPGGYDAVVFENGQGLLLDAGRRECLAHTTPSRTGLENPARLLREALGARLADADLETCYVTRTYLTRHGAGPFPGECPKSDINPDMADRTNAPNPFQGTLRYGRIDPDALADRALADAAALPGRRALAVTHLNETGGAFVTPSGPVPVADVPAVRRFDRLYLSDREDAVTGRKTTA